MAPDSRLGHSAGEVDWQAKLEVMRRAIVFGRRDAMDSLFALTRQLMDDELMKDVDQWRRLTRQEDRDDVRFLAMLYVIAATNLDAISAADEREIFALSGVLDFGALRGSREEATPALQAELKALVGRVAERKYFNRRNHARERSAVPNPVMSSGRGHLTLVESAPAATSTEYALLNLERRYYRWALAAALWIFNQPGLGRFHHIAPLWTAIDPSLTGSPSEVLKKTSAALTRFEQARRERAVTREQKQSLQEAVLVLRDALRGERSAREEHARIMILLEDLEDELSADRQTRAPSDAASPAMLRFGTPRPDERVALIGRLLIERMLWGSQRKDRSKDLDLVEWLCAQGYEVESVQDASPEHKSAEAIKWMHERKRVLPTCLLMLRYATTLADTPLSPS